MRHYYIIGTKWEQEDGSYKSMLPEMLRTKSVGVGYAWRYNLTRFYGKSEEEIVSALQRKGEPGRSLRTHRLFLRLRPGDIVAVKNFAAPRGTTPRLAIHRYAVVRARGGRIYRHSQGELSHQISVDFLNCGHDREFHIGGYGATIHHLSDQNHIRRIFAPVLHDLPKADRIELRQSSGAAQRRAVTLKNVEDQLRHINKTFKVTARHNKLQQRLYDHLVREHGEKSVLMEADYTDLQLRSGGVITLFEVKPYPSALACLREALGQIMLYSWRMNQSSSQPQKLVIVGPCKPDTHGADFLRYLKSRFGRGLDYMAFP